MILESLHHAAHRNYKSQKPLEEGLAHLRYRRFVVVTANLLFVNRAKIHRPRFFILGTAMLMGMRLIAWADSGTALAETSAASTTTIATAVPLADVPTQAESALANLHDIEAGLSSDQTTARIEKEQPPLTRELSARVEESSRLLSPTSSLDRLLRLEYSWEETADSLKIWDGELTRRIDQISQELNNIGQIDSAWQETLVLAHAPDAPAAVAQTVQSVLSGIAQTRHRVERRRAQILSLQNRVGQEEARTTRVLAHVRQARDEALSHLLSRDSPPLWSVDVSSRSSSDMVQEGEESFETQVRALRAYVERKQAKFVLHFAIFLVLAAGLFWLRRGLRGARGASHRLTGPSRVFDAPLAAAGVIALLLSPWIYPQAPRLLWSAIAGVAILPTLVLLRKLVEIYFFSIINALVALYFVDQIRGIAAVLPFISRVLFVGEMLGGLVFLMWLLKSTHFSAPAQAPPRQEVGVIADSPAGGPRLWVFIRIVARLSLVVLGAALLTNIVGYVNLSNLLGDSVLGSAYLAVTLYSVLRVIDVLLHFILNLHPVSALGMVDRHRDKIALRIHRVLKWGALIGWALYTMDLLQLYDPLRDWTEKVSGTQLGIGSVQVTPAHVIAFVVTVWGAFLISRLVRFVLEEDIFPRFIIGQGLPYAISTMLHYVILVLGFLLALSALGFDMTKFTILAGAFGVGIGFGTQNIINNFVSGLILLFERPIKVGDVIQVDDATGVVERIGIRATVIRTPTDSEVIVPNASLISNRVTNWTLSDHLRSLAIPVTVAPGADPKQVMDLLKQIVAQHPSVAKNPPPQAFVTKLGAGSLDLEVRAWTEHARELIAIRSDLTIAIHSALAREKIDVR